MNSKAPKSKTPVARSHEKALQPHIPVIPPSSVFTCFYKLPLELRIMIWKLAEPERMLYLTPPNVSRYIDHVTHLSGHRRVLNSVCTESRYETEKDYRCLTIARWSKPLNTNTVPIFNPRLDTIYVHDAGYNQQRCHFLNFLEVPKEGEMVKKFAILDSLLSYTFAVLRGKQRCLKAFMKLDELSIIVGETKLHPTRAKVLRLGLEENFDKKTFGGSLEDWQGRSCISGWWGRGLTADREDRFRKIFDLMRLMQNAEKMDKGAKMPVVKVMVINKKDFQSAS